MAYTILPCRILVLPDDGKTDRGEIVSGLAPSTFELVDPQPDPPPLTPIYERVYHTHVVFITDMAQLVTQGGTDYYCMHRDAVLGYLDD